MIQKIIVSLILLTNILAGFLSSLIKINLVLNILLSIALLVLIFLKKEKVQIVEIEKKFNGKIDDIKEESLHEKDVDPRGKNRPKTCHNCNEQIYFIKKCLPIIKKFSENTQKFEEDAIQSLFKEFDNIWTESDSIVKQSKASMESIFNPNIKNNLGYVLNASKDINSEFTSFMPILNEMNMLTDNFIRTSIKSFETISKTTQDIVELSEQVKVISINVRIEAARVKDSGGFKVLGSDISNFADKTAKVAISTNKQIKETMSQINVLRVDLSSKLNNVEKMAKKIYTKISPFEEILGSSSGSLMEIIQNLNSVSSSLQKNLNRSISKLQYQDITSQESNHILQLLSHIGEYGFFNNDINLYLSEDKKNTIKKSIINYLKDISTTINEEMEVLTLSKKWGIEIENKPNKEIDNGIVLF